MTFLPFVCDAWNQWLNCPFFPFLRFNWEISLPELNYFWILLLYIGRLTVITSFLSALLESQNSNNHPSNILWIDSSLSVSMENIGLLCFHFYLLLLGTPYAWKTEWNNMRTKICWIEPPSVFSPCIASSQGQVIIPLLTFPLRCLQSLKVDAYTRWFKQCHESRRNQECYRRPD